jgi:hypothetical protein
LHPQLLAFRKLLQDQSGDAWAAKIQLDIFGILELAAVLCGTLLESGHGWRQSLSHPISMLLFA